MLIHESFAQLVADPIPAVAVRILLSDVGVPYPRIVALADTARGFQSSAELHSTWQWTLDSPSRSSVIYILTEWRFLGLTVTSEELASCSVMTKQRANFAKRKPSALRRRKCGRDHGLALRPMYER